MHEILAEIRAFKARAALWMTVEIPGNGVTYFTTLPPTPCGNTHNVASNSEKKTLSQLRHWPSPQVLRLKRVTEWVQVRECNCAYEWEMLVCARKREGRVARAKCNCECACVWESVAVGERGPSAQVTTISTLTIVCRDIKTNRSVH